MNLQIRDSSRTLAVFAALVAIAVYVNSLANGFALDDVFIIELNNRAHNPLDFDRVWLTPYWPFYGQELGLYRPTIIFLYALQWVAGGGEPWVFHLTSILLHALVTALVFLLLSRLTEIVPALVGALLFAVHPVHTEAVANVVGQAELVGAAAVLAACLLHAGRREGAGVSWLRRLALIALYLLALSTKESTVVLPALLVLLDFVQRRVRLSIRGLAAYADAMLMPILLLAAALGVYLLIRLDVMSGSVIGVDAAPAMPYIREEYRILNALRAFPEFLRLLFFPLDLSSDYTPAVILPVDDLRPMVILGAALLIAVAVLAALTPWLPRLGFPAAWFLITMLTVLNLFFPIGVIVAERTLYLPSVAFSALVAFAWSAAAPVASINARRLAPAAAVLVIVLMGARTWIRNPDWKDTPTVWEAVYRDHPESYRAQWVRAALLTEFGQPDLAEQHYRLAYRIYSRDSQFNAQFANFMMSRGNYAEAIPMLEESHRMHPFIPATGSILAFGYVATGRFREALDMLRKMEVLEHSNLSSIMALRAYAYRGMGQLDRAAGAMRVAVRHSPETSWRARAFLGRALARAGHVDPAAEAFAAARVLAPDSAARATIDAAVEAMDGGCYVPEPVEDPPAGFAGRPRPACDPLGEWFDFAPAQNATPLQNATDTQLPGASSGAAETRE